MNKAYSVKIMTSPRVVSQQIARRHFMATRAFAQEAKLNLDESFRLNINICDSACSPNDLFSRLLFRAIERGAIESRFTLIIELTTQNPNKLSNQVLQKLSEAGITICLVGDPDPDPAFTYQSWLAEQHECINTDAGQEILVNNHLPKRDPKSHKNS